MKKYIIGFLVGILLAIPVFSYAAPSLIERVKYRVLLQVESKGEAWFVKKDGTRVYIGTPLAAWEILRKFALGISNKNLEQIPLAEDAYSLSEQASQGYQSYIKKETVYVDRVIEKPVEKIVDRVVEKTVEKIVYVDRATNQPVAPQPSEVVPPAEPVYGAPVVQEPVQPETSTPPIIQTPTALFSVSRQQENLRFEASGDDFTLEAISIYNPTFKSYSQDWLDLRQQRSQPVSLQLRLCSNLNDIWLEHTGIPYPAECSTYGFNRTDWKGRRDSWNILQVNNGTTEYYTLTDLKNSSVTYLKAVGQKTGTVVILRDI